MALAIGPPFGRRWFALSHRTVPPYRPVDELPSPSHSPCPRTLDRSLGPFASPVLCSMGELIQVSPDFLPHPSFWFTCSGAPSGAQYTLLQPQDLDPAPLGSKIDIFLAWQDGWHTEDLLRPVFMGCPTKNAKVNTIALRLDSLQRLV